MTITHHRCNPQIFSTVLFSFFIFLVTMGPALAIGESDLKDQVTAVDSALKSIANPALWAVVIYIGGMSLIKQNLVGVGIAGAGAVALTQLSGWIQTQFAAVL